MDEDEALRIELKQRGALCTFCHFEEVVPLPPLPTFSDLMSIAKGFREHIAATCTRSLCAVCATPKEKVVRISYTKIPHAHLLLDAGSKSPAYPRHAHTTTLLGGSLYCLHPHAVEGDYVDICDECMASLKRKNIPPTSLVCIDPGAGECVAFVRGALCGDPPTEAAPAARCHALRSGRKGLQPFAWAACAACMRLRPAWFPPGC
jgi:hypothetical protein